MTWNCHLKSLWLLRPSLPATCFILVCNTNSSWCKIKFFPQRNVCKNNMFILKSDCSSNKSWISNNQYSSTQMTPHRNIRLRLTDLFAAVLWLWWEGLCGSVKLWSADHILSLLVKQCVSARHSQHSRPSSSCYSGTEWKLCWDHHHFPDEAPPHPTIPQSASRLQAEFRRLKDPWRGLMVYRVSIILLIFQCANHTYILAVFKDYLL